MSNHTTRILIALTLILGPACDSNPTPHPGQLDAYKTDVLEPEASPTGGLDNDDDGVRDGVDEQDPAAGFDGDGDGPPAEACPPGADAADATDVMDASETDDDAVEDEDASDDGADSDGYEPDCGPEPTEEPAAADMVE